MDHRVHRFEHEFVRRVHELALYRHLRAGDGGVRKQSHGHDSGAKYVRRRIGPKSYDSGAVERGKKSPFVFHLSRMQEQEHPIGATF